MHLYDDKVKNDLQMRPCSKCGGPKNERTDLKSKAIGQFRI